jgi:hypothetical protein
MKQAHARAQLNKTMETTAHKQPCACGDCADNRRQSALAAAKELPESRQAAAATTCSRIVITMEITDPEVVSDYKNTCDELVWEDLANGELINFAEFVSRENV